VAVLGKQGRLREGRPHKFYVFEKEIHRLQASLSDLAGVDAHIHDGTPAGVIRAAVDALHEHADEQTLSVAMRVLAAMPVAVRADAG